MPEIPLPKGLGTSLLEKFMTSLLKQFIKQVHTTTTGGIAMMFDNWSYFDADDYVIVVNTFKEDEQSEHQVNTYVALKKDIEKHVSVHDVMIECSEMR